MRFHKSEISETEVGKDRMRKISIMEHYKDDCKRIRLVNQDRQIRRREEEKEVGLQKNWAILIIIF